MVIVASLFFATAAGFGLWLMWTMLSDSRVAILRALQMDMVPVSRPLAASVRVRRVIRQRSAVAPAQWRAAA